MKKIEVKELKDNMFETISKEWMLVTAGTKDKFNTMTANWGGIGFLWNKPVAFIFIRPERYTFDFIEQNDYLTLSFLGEEHKDVHKICGSKSGRDIDKVKATGLQPLFTENGSITFEQARLTFECKKLYADMIKPEDFIDQSIIDRWYGEAHGGFHKMYVVEIVGNLIKRAAEFLKWKAYILFLAQFPRTGSRLPTDISAVSPHSYSNSARCRKYPPTAPALSVRDLLFDSCSVPTISAVYIQNQSAFSQVPRL